MKPAVDRLVGLAMLSRDFAKRQELASAAQAPQMLNETFTRVCQCEPDCDAGSDPDPEIDCVSLINDFAEYLDEMNFTQESFGLKYISLEARLLILKLKKAFLKVGRPWWMRSFPASQNRGHNAGTAPSVHYRHNPQGLFIRRIGDQVFMYQNEAQRS